MRHTVVVRAYVDSDVRERFISRFGDYGAITFTLENAMREMLDMTEGQPDMEDLVKRSIRLHVLRTQFNPQLQPEERSNESV